MGERGEKVIPVKVAVRSRPLLQWEIDEGSKDCVNFISEAQQVVVSGNRAFTYDYIFDANVAQKVVYDKAVFPLINGIFKGYNGTVLAYGQTGSGKTYSMGSAHCVSQIGVTDNATGIIPRVIHDIFQGIETRKTHDFIVKVSYVEIYKEEVKDLLSVNTRDQSLAIRENQDGSIRISGLTEIQVSSVHHTLEYMERGNCHRSTGSTAMNSTSSRSHAIFTIVLESRCISSPEEVTCSKFHLVDLAGSERAKRTKAEGDRFQEGIKINAGLLALGNVISALGEGQHGQHIPYRVSKLTRLLQDSLGGNSLTVMIACISPADSNAEETVNTLRYADRARKIKNKAIVNRDPHTAELVQLRKEVQKLRLQLLQTSGSASTVEVIQDSPETREQLRKFEEENRQLLKEMQKLVDTNTEMCEKAISTDLSREKLETKLSELRTLAQEVVNDPHELSLMVESLETSTQQDCVKRLKELHNKILEDEESMSTTEDVITDLATTLQAQEKEDAIDANGSLDGETEEENAIKSEHILRTAKLSNQLQELSKALAMKEDLAKRMCASDETMGALRSQYENRLKKLDKELTDLQNERDGLAAALETAQKTNESQKLSEKRRVRLTELESQIKNLKKEKKEKEKVTKLKAQSDQKIITLHNEIQAIKSSRVKLMRQIKEESVKFKVWKKDKEREVKQLKEKNRKRAFEMVKLERDYNNQKNVLRRKTEEAAASNRRLKEALMKQRLATDKRQQSMSKTLDSANSRMKVGMEEDIEIAVCSKQAKKHLGELEEDLKVLKEQLENVYGDVSPSKRRRTYTKSDGDELRLRKGELTDECELKEAQIKEMRSKLVDAKEARMRQQARLIQITSIAEARSVMKHLFNLVVDSRASEEACIDESKNLHNQLRAAKLEVHRLQESLDEFDKNKEADLTSIENVHQEQILYLTKQLNQSAGDKAMKSSSQREADLASQIKLQANLIEKLTKEKDEFEKRNDELEKVRSPGSNGCPPLFQPIEEPAGKPKMKKSTAKKPTTFIEFDELDDEVDDQIISDYDSDYIPTPIIRKSRQRSIFLKPKLSESQETFCHCPKSRCKTKTCRCKKAGVACSDLCKCARETCMNTEPPTLLASSNASSQNNSTNSTSTCSSSEQSLQEEKENSAPYYKRMGSLLNTETSDVPSKKTPDQSIYQPLYFQSPIREQEPCSNEQLKSRFKETAKLEFVKPKSAITKKRKLHSTGASFFD